MGCHPDGADGVATVVREPPPPSVLPARLECAESATLLAGPAAGGGAEARAKRCTHLAQDWSHQLGVPGVSRDCQDCCLILSVTCRSCELRAQ